MEDGEPGTRGCSMTVVVLVAVATGVGGGGPEPGGAELDGPMGRGNPPGAPHDPPYCSWGGSSHTVVTPTLTPFIFFFLCVPSYISGVHHFGGDFCVRDCLLIQP